VKYVKVFIELSQILGLLDVKNLFYAHKNIIYNDNQAGGQWSKQSTTKGLCHIQMREN
jgi:hypothetical protein